MSMLCQSMSRGAAVLAAALLLSSQAMGAGILRYATIGETMLIVPSESQWRFALTSAEVAPVAVAVVLSAHTGSDDAHPTARLACRLYEALEILGQGSRDYGPCRSAIARCVLPSAELTPRPAALSHRAMRLCRDLADA